METGVNIGIDDGRVEFIFSRLHKMEMKWKGEDSGLWCQ